MQNLANIVLPDRLPQAVIDGHQHLPKEALEKIETQVFSQATQQLIELSVVAQYERGDIYLSDVAQALGLYPDIAATMEWLQARGVYIGPSPANAEYTRSAVNELVIHRRGQLAANHG